MAFPTWGLCFVILEFLEQRELEGNTFGRVLDGSCLSLFFSSLGLGMVVSFFFLRSCWGLFEIGENCRYLRNSIIIVDFMDYGP